jgi:hypothetical protein
MELMNDFLFMGSDYLVYLRHSTTKNRCKSTQNCLNQGPRSMRREYFWKMWGLEKPFLAHSGTKFNNLDNKNAAKIAL